MSKKYKYQPELQKQQSTITNSTESSISSKKYNKDSTSSVSKTNSQIKSSLMMYVKKAPRNQFVKYLDDSQNVFYEDRQSARRLNEINQYKPTLLKFTIFFLFWYIIIFSIDPYQNQCPKHAWCGAYVHCDAGYILTGKKCDIDPKIIEKAKQWVESKIQNIKYNQGNQQCWGPSEEILESLKINQIMKNNDIDDSDQLLKSRIRKQFQDYNNQKLLKFSLNSYGQIYVMEKKYSYSCKFYLFSQTKQFLISVLIGLIIIVGAFLYNKKRKLNRKVCQIYKLLHESVKKNHKIDVKQQLANIQKLHPNLHVNHKIWMLVDNQRVKKAEIVYYEDIKLYWKLLI